MNTVEYQSKTQNYCDCAKCKESFIFEPDECWWDEKSIGYSTKLVKCKHCGCINVIKYIEDNWIQDYEFDSTLYDY